MVSEHPMTDEKTPPPGWRQSGSEVRGGGYEEYPEVECPRHTTEKRLLTKIDLHVIPFLSIMYLLAFLDRTNIANASLFGMMDDLDLTGTKYNTALTIFFVPYIIFEIPSNILLKKLRPHIWLAICLCLFGIVTICQGLVQSYSGLLATRFFLGLAETGMFPGCFYLIGMWYKRLEAQRRYSLFFSSTTLAGAFGGLLASAIGKMDGLHGFHGWRWIFILEGAATVVIGAFFFFLLPDFPEMATWLEEDEREYVKARLAKEQGNSGADARMSLSDILEVFKDGKIVIGGFMYFGLIVPSYGFAYFAPTIINSYGYSTIHTQLISVPPWAAAFVLAMTVAILSDKLKHRFTFAILPICIAIAGLAILLTVHDNTHVDYAALFLVAMGCYSAMPVVVCWFNMNLGGHKRRSIGSAWQVSFGNIGGIIATYSFLSKDKPYYTPGYSICLGFLCLSILSCFAYLGWCLRENRMRSRAARDIGLTEWEKTNMGDRNPDYRNLL